MGHTFNLQLSSLQLCLNRHFLLAHSLKLSRGESLGLSQMFSAYSSCPACIWPCRFPRICGCFSKFLSFKAYYFPVFSPMLFSVSIICFNCYPLPKWQQLIQLPLIVYNKCLPVAIFTPWESSELGQIEATPPSQSFREPSGRWKASFSEHRSALPQPAPATHTRNAGCRPQDHS